MSPALLCASVGSGSPHLRLGGMGSGTPMPVSARRLSDYFLRSQIPTTIGYFQCSTRRWGPPMMFESLEGRQLLSVTAVYRNDGVLIITGTPGRDHIEVSISNDISPGDTSVNVKGQGALVEGPGMPTGVIIIGGGGADNLSIGQSM